MRDITFDTSSPKGDEAAPAKSEAQQLLERMHATLLRLGKVRDRLQQIRGSIAGRGNVVADNAAPLTSSKTTVFFDAMRKLADAGDQVTEDLEKSAEDLAGLF
jgi:hypothetical protein